jgi:hypothetical protein
MGVGAGEQVDGVTEHVKRRAGRFECVAWAARQV